jgi:radical SAM superfamily enzyme YgiQ (UPF0313 family)
MKIAYASLLPTEADDRFLRPPLFAGYLSAYATANRPGKDEHDIVDAWALNELPNLDATADRLVRGRSDIVALTVFVWNHKRVAKLCRKIRRRSPRTRLILGGPEVAFTPIQALRRFDADWVCSGEGEMAFLNLLNELDRNPAYKSSLPGLLHRDDQSTANLLAAPMIRNLDDIPSPYLTGLLALDRDGFVDLETTRGCPYRCRFCLYGKTFDTLRHFSLERTEKDVRYAIENGATDIYLMDPTFNYPRERCRKVCKILARLNPDRRVDFHTEARAEVMDEALADDFVRAGIIGVEIGLQSTSKETLKLMKRGLGTSHFLKGCKLLFERGITTEIGMIAGLPGDSVASVRETANFVINQSLGELTTHRLQMLPGSDYYKMAEELGLKYDPNPPYFIMSTPTMTKKDIVGVVAELENAAEQPNEDYNEKVTHNCDNTRRRERRTLKCRATLLRRLRAIHRKARQASEKLRPHHLESLNKAFCAFPSGWQPNVSVEMERARVVEARDSQIPRYVKRYLAGCNDSRANYLPFLANAYRSRRKELLALLKGKQFIPLDFDNGVQHWFEFCYENRKGTSEWLQLPIEDGSVESRQRKMLHLSWISACWCTLLSGPGSVSLRPSKVDRIEFEVCVLSEIMFQLEIGTLRLEEAFDYDGDAGWGDANRLVETHTETPDEEMGDPVELQISGTLEKQAELAIV